MVVASTLRVLVTALTYRRPDDLAALLPALVDQARRSTAFAEVAIVDNDPDGGAEPIVSAERDAALAQAAEHAAVDPDSAEVGTTGAGRTPVGIRYLHVPEPGIAAARNAALDAAAGFDLIVFIDDDERPVERWLEKLIETYLMRRSTAVVGPVISEYAAEPDPWITAGAFFSRRRMPTGSPVDLAATNNLLLDVRQIRELGLRFDERFGLSGGSDTLFTRQLHARGGTMIWCDEAVVVDMVPRDRLTRGWVVRRAFRSGNTWMRTSVELAPTAARRAATRIKLSTLGVARLLAGSARVTWGLVSGRVHHRAKGVRTIARGAGLVAGSFGSVYSEYRR